jgi:hypothetical protein
VFKCTTPQRDFKWGFQYILIDICADGCYIFWEGLLVNVVVCSDSKSKSHLLIDICAGGCYLFWEGLLVNVVVCSDSKSKSQLCNKPAGIGQMALPVVLFKLISCLVPL